jgi:hypothetical protein
MAAEFIGRPPTHVENDHSRLPQAFLKGFGINQQWVCHVVPFVMNISTFSLELGFAP